MSQANFTTTAMKDSVLLKKEAYKEKAEAQLLKWRARLADIEAKSEEFGADKQLKYQEYREQLRGQVDKVSDALQSLSDMGNDAWDDAKLRIEYLWEGLEDTWAYWTSFIKSTFKNK